MTTSAAAGATAGLRTRRRTPPRRAVALASAALALVAGCSAATGSGTGSPPDATRTSAVTATASPGHGTGTATPSRIRPLARSVPVRLRIPSIGVDTAVMSLGLASDGTVAVPPIAAHAPAGWYDGSPTPGELGPSVLLGHVTVGRYGDGVFVRLARMRPGDRISVTRRDGSVAVFAAERVQTVPKSHFPTQSVYGNVDHPALRLITCGGSRLSGGGGYTDNVIVYASLVPAS